jgi:predicted branched-subunit amino acid permease
MTPGSEAGGAATAGARRILPLAVAVFPFGLVYGVAVAEAQFTNWVGGLASLLILAGAAQLAMVDLADQGAPWVVAVGTALIINVRFVMYSGALAPSFSEYPRIWRIPLAHLMTDQAAVTSLLYNDGDHDPLRRRWFYLGAGGTMVFSWVAGTWFGILIGGGIPDGWQLDFAIPLMFLALLIPSIRDRAGLVAAIVGAAVTLLARDVPFNTGLLVGAVCGITAGMVVKR